ncbi:MAG TPA: hypothetical protein VFA82_01655 [Gaiellaceae bacterium]|nr:hypothetical protein [Gaiellaceae bacterium]
MTVIAERPRSLLAPAVAIALLAGAGAAVAVEPAAALAFPLGFLAVAALARPDLAVMGLLVAKPVLDYFVRHRVAGVSLGQMWGGMLLLAAAAVVVRDREGAPPISAYRAPIVMVLAYPLLTLPRANVANAPLNELRLVSWLAVVYVVEQIASTAEGQRRVVRVGFAMAFLLTLVVAAMEHTNQYGRAYYSSTLAFSKLDVMAPSGVSAFAVYCASLAIVPLVGGRRSFWPLLLYAALGAAVVLSLVRTSFLAFLLVLGGVLARGIQRRRGSVVTAGGVVAGAVLVAIVSYQHVISTRLVHASGRVLFWRPVIDGTLADPLAIVIGHGPAYSFAVIQQTLNEAIWSHDDFVDLFGTGGVVLLTAYILLVLWLFRSALSLLRDPRQSPRAQDVGQLAFLGCAAYVLIALFNDAAFASPTVAVAVLIGLARGMARTPGTTWLD